MNVETPITQIGLTSAEAAARLQSDGPNQLPEPKLPGAPEVFFRQFLSPFIYILLIAAILSWYVGQTPSAVFIIVVLLLNAAIGAAQELSAQKSAAALRNMVKGSAQVIRDGAARTIPVEDVVVGDLVLLRSGDKIPADVRLAGSDNLYVDESMLTGESFAIRKDWSADAPPDAPLADRRNTCFAGSVVTRGRGRGIAVNTGLRTEIGDIASHVAERRISEPPLLIRIRRFTYQVAGAILVAIVLLIAFMALRGGYGGADMVMMGIGLAVSTIPEGLPA
ncbi:MAG: HAD-IC family P-type ATPase, partial [Pseudomonadota bacterium]